MQKLHFVVNPEAGGAGRISKDSLAAAARAAGRTAVLHHPVSTLSATEVFSTLASDGVDRVVVVGGDGAVHLAANALRRTDTALAIVPTGTGNDAASGLGIPKRLDRAVLTAVGPTRTIDLIRVGANRWAVTIATAGFSVDVNERAEMLRWPTGSAAYTVATLLEIQRRAIRSMTITTDGVAVEHEATFVAVANTALFGGGMKIAPGARPDDGLLDVIVIGAVPRRDLVRLLPAARKGRHVSDSRVSVVSGSEIRIESREAAVVRADGEVIAPLPLDLAVDRAALQFAGPDTAH